MYILNNCIKATIPANQSEIIVNFVDKLEKKRLVKNIISVKYRIDTCGVYNIKKKEIAIKEGITGDHITIHIKPGYYDINSLKNEPFNEFINISENGENAFKAMPHTIGKIDLTTAPESKKLLAWDDDKINMDYIPINHVKLNPLEIIYIVITVSENTPPITITVFTDKIGKVIIGEDSVKVDSFNNIENIKINLLDKKFEPITLPKDTHLVISHFRYVG